MSFVQKKGKRENEWAANFNANIYTISIFNKIQILKTKKYKKFVSDPITQWTGHEVEWQTQIYGPHWALIRRPVAPSARRAFGVNHSAMQTATGGGSRVSWGTLLSQPPNPTSSSFDRATNVMSHPTGGKNILFKAAGFHLICCLSQKQPCEKAPLSKSGSFEGKKTQNASLLGCTQKARNQMKRYMKIWLRRLRGGKNTRALPPAIQKKRLCIGEWHYIVHCVGNANGQGFLKNGLEKNWIQVNRLHDFL